MFPYMSRGEAHSNPFARFVLTAFSSEATVYGIVLVSALIAVGWEYQTDLEVLVFIIVTTLVFWITHVYARTVAVHDDGTEDPADVPVRAALGEAIRHSSGMLLAMLVPAVFLVLAEVGVLDQYVAYYLALWVSIGMLVVVGYVAAMRRRRPIWRRLISGLVTGLLGLLVVGLGILAH